MLLRDVDDSDILSVCELLTIVIQLLKRNKQEIRKVVINEYMRCPAMRNRRTSTQLS